jgi:hypothetical protein
MIMSKTILSIVLALGVLSGAVQAIAQPKTTFTDMSQRYGGHAPNSPEGQRAFWEYQAR